MVRYQFVVEGETLSGLLEELKFLLGVVEEQKAKEAELQERLGTRLVATPSRKNKAWSQTELVFLRTHYADKKLAWIAQALSRPKTGVSQKLTKLYAEGLPPKNHRSSKVLITQPTL